MKNKLKNRNMIISVILFVVTGIIGFIICNICMGIDHLEDKSLSVYLSLASISFQVTFLTISLLGGLSDKSEKIYWDSYPDKYLINSVLSFLNLSVISFISLGIQVAMIFCTAGLDEKIRFTVFIVAFLISILAIIYLNFKFTSVYYSKTRYLRRTEKEFEKKIGIITDDESTEEEKSKAEYWINKNMFILVNNTMEAADNANIDRIMENVLLLMRHSMIMMNKSEGNADSERKDYCWKWLRRIIKRLSIEYSNVLGEVLLRIDEEVFNSDINHMQFDKDAFYDELMNIAMVYEVWEISTDGWQKWFWNYLDKKIDDYKENHSIDDDENINALSEFRHVVEPYFTMFSDVSGNKREYCKLLSKVFEFMGNSEDKSADFEAMSGKHIDNLLSWIESAFEGEDTEALNVYLETILDGIDKGMLTGFRLGGPDITCYYYPLYDGLAEILQHKCSENILRFVSCLHRLNDEVSDKMYAFIAQIMIDKHYLRDIWVNYGIDENDKLINYMIEKTVYLGKKTVETSENEVKIRYAEYLCYLKKCIIWLAEYMFVSDLKTYIVAVLQNLWVSFDEHDKTIVGYGGDEKNDEVFEIYEPSNRFILIYETMSGIDKGLENLYKCLEKYYPDTFEGFRIDDNISDLNKEAKGFIRYLITIIENKQQPNEWIYKIVSRLISQPVYGLAEDTSYIKKVLDIIAKNQYGYLIRADIKELSNIIDKFRRSETKGWKHAAEEYEKYLNLLQPLWNEVETEESD